MFALMIAATAEGILLAASVRWREHAGCNEGAHLAVCQRGGESMLAFSVLLLVREGGACEGRTLR